MKMEEKEKEKIIANYLSENFPIKQMRFNMYDSDDLYFKIPQLVFRFDNDESPYYDAFSEALKTFNGNLKWVIFKDFYGKRVHNYGLVPEELYKMEKLMFENELLMSPKEYFPEPVYRELCEKAVSDIPLLLEHLKANFKGTKKQS